MEVQEEKMVLRTENLDEKISPANGGKPCVHRCYAGGDRGVART